MSFKCKDTELVFTEACPARFRSIQARAERKLALLDAAETMEFLRSPPGNRLEKLTGDRAGSWSIRINEKWQICFVFESGHVNQVEIVDYN